MEKMYHENLTKEKLYHIVDIIYIEKASNMKKATRKKIDRKELSIRF
jgi:hypothetical protein